MLFTISFLTPKLKSLCYFWFCSKFGIENRLVNYNGYRIRKFKASEIILTPVGIHIHYLNDKKILVLNFIEC